MNRDQVLALAPDKASITAAQKLTTLSKWPQLAYNDRAIWGECKGSGSKPYQTRIDRQDNTVKCSCPSRKFPCKHALALYLIFTDQPASFTAEAPLPEWVSEWLNKREAAQQKKQTRSQTAKISNPDAQKKRRIQREKKILNGVNELAQWLEDSVRMGFSELVTESYQYWDALAARLVDAQAPGLAAWIRHIGDIAIVNNPQSMDTLAYEVGQLFLFINAYQKLSLDTHGFNEALANELHSLAGRSYQEQEILQQEGLDDDWLVLARSEHEEQQLIRQDIWFFGLRNKRFAKQTQYAHTSQKNKIYHAWIEGSTLSGKMHFYPTLTPLRAMIGEHQVQHADTHATENCQRWLELLQSTSDGLQAYRQQLSQNPWLKSYPILLTDCIPYWDKQQLFFLRTTTNASASQGQMPQTGHTLALSGESKHCDIDKLLALSGHEAVPLLGEWNGQRFKPIGIFSHWGYEPLLNKGYPQ